MRSAIRIIIIVLLAIACWGASAPKNVQEFRLLNWAFGQATHFRGHDKSVIYFSYAVNDKKLGLRVGPVSGWQGRNGGEFYPLAGALDSMDLFARREFTGDAGERMESGLFGLLLLTRDLENYSIIGRNQVASRVKQALGAEEWEKLDVWLPRSGVEFAADHWTYTVFVESKRGGVEMWFLKGVTKPFRLLKQETHLLSPIIGDP